MKTTTGSGPSTLKYYTDYKSFIIELNSDAASTFYIVWADDIYMNNMTYLNSAGDNLNSDIMSDFASASRIASFVQGNKVSYYESILMLWIYDLTSIIKYKLTTIADSNKIVYEITIAKEFSVAI